MYFDSTSATVGKLSLYDQQSQLNINGTESETNARNYTEKNAYVCYIITYYVIPFKNMVQYEFINITDFWQLTYIFPRSVYRLTYF